MRRRATALTALAALATGSPPALPGWEESCKEGGGGEVSDAPGPAGGVMCDAGMHGGRCENSRRVASTSRPPRTPRGYSVEACRGAAADAA
mmetsp:Transcript_6036/g.19099  ORF Transcript_6036/g.19099 Transcript_6036/m.19099 type:complete len:91 (+) Transcript_6036:445-717(+)